MAKALDVSESIAAVWNIINSEKKSLANETESPSKESGDSQKDLSSCPETLSECPFCHKLYKRSLNLRRHVVNVHNVKYVDVQSKLGTIKCGFDEACEASFDRSVFYRKHLFKVHKIDLGKKVLYFETEDDFEAWKHWEQTQIGAKFNKRYKSTPSQRNLKVKKFTFLCSYSVHNKVKDKVLKRRSKKIDSCCPARMDAIFGKDNIIVSYFSTHVGHLMETTETVLKRERKRQCTVQRRKRKVFEAAKQRAESLCSELLQKIEAERYSTEYMVDIASKIGSILDASEDHMQKPLPAENKVIDVSFDSNSPSESISDGLGLVFNNPRSILKPRAFTSSFNRSKESDENCESVFSNMNVGEGNTTVESEDDIFKELPYIKYGKRVLPFRGKVKFINPKSQPTDGPLEEKIRKHGFLYNLETITPVIARDMLKDDFVFPSPPSEETKTLYEDVWNKYKNSLSTSKSDHNYTGS